MQHSSTATSAPNSGPIPVRSSPVQFCPPTGTVREHRPPDPRTPISEVPIADQPSHTSGLTSIRGGKERHVHSANRLRPLRGYRILTACHLSPGYIYIDPHHAPGGKILSSMQPPPPHVSLCQRNLFPASPNTAHTPQRPQNPPVPRPPRSRHIYLCRHGSARTGTGNASRTTGALLLRSSAERRSRCDVSPKPRAFENRMVSG